MQTCNRRLQQCFSPYTNNGLSRASYIKNLVYRKPTERCGHPPHWFLRCYFPSVFGIIVDLFATIREVDNMGCGRPASSRKGPPRNWFLNKGSSLEQLLDSGASAASLPCAVRPLSQVSSQASVLELRKCVTAVLATLANTHDSSSELYENGLHAASCLRFSCTSLRWRCFE